MKLAQQPIEGGDSNCTTIMHNNKIPPGGDYGVTNSGPLNETPTGGLVAASFAVVSAGKPCRCGEDSAEAFARARGVGLSSASEEWEARRTNHSMLQG